MDQRPEPGDARPEVVDPGSQVVADTLSRPDVHAAWNAEFFIPENEWFYERAFELIARVLSNSGGRRVLDAGCGSAMHAMRLARRSFDVHGVDFSGAALETARRNLERHGLEDEVHIQRGTLLNLGFADESFDHVVSWGVLMHIPEVEVALGELARVTRPGGTLVLSEGNMRSLQAVMMRRLRRLSGRGRAEERRTPTGVEYWIEGRAGTHMKRHTDINWLVNAVERHGFYLEQRRAGQFTELYTRFSHRPITTVLHLLNRLWFQYVHWAGPAHGNILIFRRMRAEHPDLVGK